MDREVKMGQKDQKVLLDRGEVLDPRAAMVQQDQPDHRVTLEMTGRVADQGQLGSRATLGRTAAQVHLDLSDNVDQRETWAHRESKVRQADRVPLGWTETQVTWGQLESKVYRVPWDQLVVKAHRVETGLRDLLDLRGREVYRASQE